MTYIEFFDKIASENICAALTWAPDRVIYIGDDKKAMDKHIKNYKKVFAARGKDIDFISKTASKSKLEHVVKVLSEIVETYDDCVFDITGGEEIMLLAMGMVYTKYPDRNIQIHKFNLRNNQIYSCDKDGITLFEGVPTPKLSIEENIQIYGGEVAYGTIDEDNTYKWDMNPDFLKDIDRMWDVCRKDVRYWNMMIGILNAAEEVGGQGNTKLTTVVSRAALEDYLIRHKSKYKPAQGIISSLLKHRLLTAFSDDGTTVTVSYKNPQVKKCLTKAGQALEMKIFAAVSGLRKGDEPMYSDALNGVVIDWDGEFHDESVEDTYDTENEIDIILMHDIVPIFISCKNGVVDSDELYKLDTVAERFGGKYAKKYLVATSVSDLGEAGKYLRQRAKDMGIMLIEGVQYIDDAELEKELRNLWEKTV